MAGESRSWFWQARIETFKGRKMMKGGETSDPARHMGEYLGRFYRTAKKITWWPVDSARKNAKPIGPERVVEFDINENLEHVIVSRTPDDDTAHVGGLKHDEGPHLGEDENWWKKTGHSRKGFNVAEQRHLGQAPSHGDLTDDENEMTIAELEELHKEVQQRLANAQAREDAKKKGVEVTTEGQPVVPTNATGAPITASASPQSAAALKAAEQTDQKKVNDGKKTG